MRASAQAGAPSGQGQTGTLPFSKPEGGVPFTLARFTRLCCSPEKPQTRLIACRSPHLRAPRTDQEVRPPLLAQTESTFRPLSGARDPRVEVGAPPLRPRLERYIGWAASARLRALPPRGAASPSLLTLDHAGDRARSGSHPCQAQLSSEHVDYAAVHFRVFFLRHTFDSRRTTFCSSRRMDMLASCTRLS